VEVLHAENVLARKYFWPGCHRMQPYKALFPNAYLLLPNTELRSAQVMVLPTGQSVTTSDVATVCAIIKSALGQAHKVRRILGNRKTGNQNQAHWAAHDAQKV
jgi:dTDP-4-amino-4,6-dideoxygalactose transaminase